VEASLESVSSLRPSSITHHTQSAVDAPAVSHTGAFTGRVVAVNAPKRPASRILADICGAPVHGRCAAMSTASASAPRLVDAMSISPRLRRHIGQEESTKTMQRTRRH
jgi:hypothetical protein